MWSDGGENASHTHLDDLTRRLTSSGVRLFVSFIFGRLGYRNRSPEGSNGPDELKGLIDKTGGEMIVPFANGIPTNPKEVEQFTALMKAFHRGMIENYLIEVELPPDRREAPNLGAEANQRKARTMEECRSFLPLGTISLRTVESCRLNNVQGLRPRAPLCQTSQ